MIKLERVSKSFGRLAAVKDLSFEAESGKVTGFLGPNGAGKTTTLRLISGYLTCDSGRVMVQGLDHGHQGMEIRKKLGYLPENTPLYPDMTVVEYLFMVARLRGMSNKAAKGGVAAMVALCGLDQRLKQPLGTLSKGYRQRVGLAQAMIHDPDILILDEPTTGLDPNQIRYIKDLIKELGRSKTLLLSTHILHQIPELCDYVVILNEGCLAFSGTPQELMARAGVPQYANLDLLDPARDLSSLLEKEGLVGERVPFSQMDGVHRYRLRGEFSASNMARLTARLQSHNLKIAGFAAEPLSLDMIFARLTNGKGPS